MPVSLLIKLTLSAIFFMVSSMELINMWRSHASSLGFMAVAANFRSSSAQCNTNSLPVDLTWHPPTATTINNLTAVINGTGVNGFHFDAVTPSTEPYRTYNWCNMPHVRRQEYVVPPPDFRLEYVEVVSPLQFPPVSTLTPQDPTPPQTHSLRRQYLSQGDVLMEL